MGLGHIEMKIEADMDERDAKVIKDVEEHGWHVIKVLADESGPAFAYSIGLFQSFKHPEILIVGLAPDTMHQIINNIGIDVKQGKAFQVGSLYNDILDGYDCAFREVLPEYYRLLFGWAVWFYNGTDFPVVQCVWPDRNQHFPWDRNCEVGIRRDQRTYSEVSR